MPRPRSWPTSSRPAVSPSSAGAAAAATAFVAEYGAGAVTVGLVAEYDALPGLGHACGHNIIAAAAVGAAEALAGVAADLGTGIRVVGPRPKRVAAERSGCWRRGASTTWRSR